MRLFDDEDDYGAFVGCVREALERVEVDLYAFCVMPNHFHLILRPHRDPDLTQFMRLMALRHAKRWHKRRGTRGEGAVYQGRFRAFPIETDRYFVAACRYVEANPLRANLVNRAEDWPWSSLRQRVKNCHLLKLAEWPILRPDAWTDLVNETQNRREIGQLRGAAKLSIPLGEASWREMTASRLGIAPRLRRPGPRPRIITLKSGINSSN